LRAYNPLEMSINKLPQGFEMPVVIPGKKPADTTIVVAMSGGVDSSAVAALYQAAGYNVVGITLQLWDYTPASNGGAIKAGGTCCALDDVYDARRVCQKLGIPHYVLNMEKAFKEAVIDDFVETYAAGETPIPCVRCNQRIKFVALLDKAKALGADAMATGHYVIKDVENGKPVLKRGAFSDKDQSYYLFTTTPEQLEYLHFPLGQYAKPQVREWAKQLGLHVHVKKDSYDICFVPGGDYRKVVKKFDPAVDAPGNVIDLEGNVLGTHDGIIGFTVGQRKGLPGGSAEALYVVEIRPDSREVVVGPRKALGRKVFTVREVNQLSVISDRLAVRVKVRAQHEGVSAVIHDLGDGRVEVVMADADHISPGQAAVFYTDSGVMLGGGWIEGSRTAEKPLNIRKVVIDEATALA
jgi:tRNA-specific 2-thiouridylase